MEAGNALTQIFEQAVARGEVKRDDLFDTDYLEIAGTNPQQYRTKYLDWADRALPPFQEAIWCGIAADWCRRFPNSPCRRGRRA